MLSTLHLQITLTCSGVPICTSPGMRLSCVYVSDRRLTKSSDTPCTCICEKGEPQPGAADLVHITGPPQFPLRPGWNARAISSSPRAWQGATADAGESSQDQDRVQPLIDSAARHMHLKLLPHTPAA